jgi:glycosyltransferase involved in cell wall biosynthesis
VALDRRADPVLTEKGVAVNPEGVSVVVPAYNEEKGIGSLIEQVSSEMARRGGAFELLVVDDGSTDRTRDSIQAHADKVRLLCHDANRGYGAALKTGIQAARYPVVLIIDADGTYPTAEIPRLLDELRPEVDMVVGARTGAEVTIPLLRKPAKWVLRRLAEYLSERAIPDLNSGLRAFRRDSVRRYLHILPNRFSTTITLCFLSDGLGVAFVPINYYKRVGKSKIKPVDALNFLILIVRTVTYFNPLRIFLPLSLGFFGLTAARVGYDVFVLSNLTDSTTILFVGTVLTAAIGILADLIVRRR